MRAPADMPTDLDEQACGTATCAVVSDGGGATCGWDGGSDSDAAVLRPSPGDAGPLPRRLAMFKARQLAVQVC